ncbi:cation diffusion facilitator family transporter [Jatrophihabitans sp. GAS493]|uniref:cation diffusion facilitator family transporter n=1 Tax=Jatrophihabitans sp. GAS493 TaxID=1907575 RepID=UPI000BB80A06|nr:cation diffusion facilitator family transporter [Jatrophihabitans sp. GAS493]SOD71879.1 cation diffusion facilitator family transporter [Jatrophihabitans sp. GAS493]
MSEASTGTSDDTSAAPPSGGESRLTVLLALAANIGVALAKLAAGLFTGSSALLSEAAHSFGDSSTEVLLLTALSKSKRRADRVHPFGYGKERYFWSLFAAIGIFASGAAFSIYEGLHTMLGHYERASESLWINYPVLIIAGVLEGLSLRQGVRQARGAARRHGRSLVGYLHDPDDPTVKSVVLEDTTAIIGLVIAATGVALHQITGSAFWDGAASLLIGLLLVIVAFLLARTCEILLIGQQADVRLIQAVDDRLAQQPEIDSVVDVLTMMVGTDQVLLCVRADFVDTFTAGELEDACVRIDRTLREEFSELDEIFIQPTARSDAAVRARVVARYGRSLADERELRDPA